MSWTVLFCLKEKMISLLISQLESFHESSSTDSQEERKIAIKSSLINIIISMRYSIHNSHHSRRNYRRWILRYFYVRKLWFRLKRRFRLKCLPKKQQSCAVCHSFCVFISYFVVKTFWFFNFRINAKLEINFSLIIHSAFWVKKFILEHS